MGVFDLYSSAKAKLYSAANTALTIYDENFREKIEWAVSIPVNIVRGMIRPLRRVPFLSQLLSNPEVVSTASVPQVMPSIVPPQVIPSSLASPMQSRSNVVTFSSVSSVISSVVSPSQSNASVLSVSSASTGVSRSSNVTSTSTSRVVVPSARLESPTPPNLVIPRENLRVATRESIVTNVVCHLGTMIVIDKIVKPFIAVFSDDATASYSATTMQYYLAIHYMLKNIFIERVLVRSAREIASAFQRMLNNNDEKKSKTSHSDVSDLAKSFLPDNGSSMLELPKPCGDGYVCRAEEEKKEEEADYTRQEIYSQLNYPINIFISGLIAKIVGPVPGFILSAFLNGNSITEYILVDEKLCPDHRNQVLARNKSYSFGTGVLIEGSVLLLSRFTERVTGLGKDATKAIFFNMAYQLVAVLSLLKSQSAEPLPGVRPGRDFLYPQRVYTYERLLKLEKKLTDDKAMRDRWISRVRNLGSVAWMSFMWTTEMSPAQLIKIPGVVFYLDRYSREIEVTLKPLQSYLKKLEKNPIRSPVDVLKRLRYYVLNLAVALTPIAQAALPFLPVDQMIKTVGRLLDGVDVSAAIQKVKEMVNLVNGLIVAHKKLHPISGGFYSSSDAKTVVQDRPELDVKRQLAEEQAEKQKQIDQAKAEKMQREKAKLDEIAKNSGHTVRENHYSASSSGSASSSVPPRELLSLFNGGTIAVAEEAGRKDEQARASSASTAASGCFADAEIISEEDAAIFSDEFEAPDPSNCGRWTVSSDVASARARTPTPQRAT